MLVGVAAGVAVGITVVVGSGGEAGVAVASGAVGLGAGVAPVQAIRVIRMTVNTVVTRRKDFGIGGGPSFGEVHLPFYRESCPLPCPQASETQDLTCNTG